MKCGNKHDIIKWKYEIMYDGTRLEETIWRGMMPFEAFKKGHIVNIVDVKHTTMFTIL